MYLLYLTMINNTNTIFLVKWLQKRTFIVHTEVTKTMLFKDHQARNQDFMWGGGGGEGAWGSKPF